MVPDKLLNDIFNNNVSYKFGYLTERGRVKKSNKIISKVVGIAIAIPIIIFVVVPYLLDLPKLATGNFSYITGYVTDIRHEKKILMNMFKLMEKK